MSRLVSLIAIFCAALFGDRMNGQAHRDLSELAYHIVNLCSFWRRTGSDSPRKNEINVLSKMIAICLGIDDASKIARAVALELDSLTINETDGEIDPDGIEVVFVSTLLQEQIRELQVPQPPPSGPRCLSHV